MSDIIFTDTQRAINQTKVREEMGRVSRIKHVINIFTCDFEQCEMNIDGFCTATKDVQCPKNNSQSVYENPELLKDKDRRIKPHMNRKELIKLANDEIAEWEKFKEDLKTKSDKEKL